MTKLEKAAKEYVSAWDEKLQDHRLKPLFSSYKKERDKIVEIFIAGAYWQQNRDVEIAESVIKHWDDTEGPDSVGSAKDVRNKIQNQE